MRLIDADYILSALGVFTSEEPESAHFMNGIKTAREIVEDAPTVEEQEPVEPGTSFDRPVCGVCGYHLILMDNYCPRCGRKVKWDAD